VDAIQLELPGELRHEQGEDTRNTFSKHLAAILAHFMNDFY